ncbi:MAG TPA: hypothetical protein VKY85_07700 [Candidatus Angelobacter sp.]|nr:hypothetical protein [Candidatus Angelobacter sp.]
MPHDPWFWIFFGWVIFSGLVSGMPEPDSKDGKGYRWMYSSLHAIAANFKTAWNAAPSTKLPAGPVDPDAGKV